MQKTPHNANELQDGDRQSDMTTANLMPRRVMQALSPQEVIAVAGGPETEVGTGAVPPR